MFETSRDILNIAAASSLVLIAIFLSWFFYYLTKIIREIHRLSKSVQEKLDLFDNVLNTIKEKLDHSATYFGILVKLVEKYTDRYRERKQNSDTQNNNLGE